MGVKGYKAFEKGMKCKGKQYEENTTYEEFGDSICNEGVMHFCENPFYVLNYYPLIDENGDFSEFAKVEALGNVYSKNDKLATNKIHIGAKLDFKSFIKACIDFTLEKTKFDNQDNSAQIGSSGDSAKIGSSGDYAKISSCGKNSVVMAAGYRSIARAKIGSWITLAEWIKTNETTKDGFPIWKPICVKTEYVDGTKIKGDMFYKLVDGEFKEIK